MTRKEFMDQVLLPLGRLTGDEREAVRRELEEHIEDRMEALLDMGWSEELAEARCLEAMGDPAEIGREMAKQYRGRGWLWISRTAVLLAVVTCIQVLLGIGMLSGARDSLTARICPEDMVTSLGYVDASERVDIREAVGNDVVRVFRVSVGLRDGQRAAEVMACVYDQMPFGIAVAQLAGRCELKNERGETGNSRSGSSSWGAGYAKVWTPIEPEDTYVVWEYQALGEMVQISVPLPGEGET